MKIGILGLGQVGQAILQLYKRMSSHEIYTKDLDHDNINESIDYLNICLPWNDRFIETVSSISRFANVIIVHSTVPVGTCDKLSMLTKKPVVHSPIRGVHPNLFGGVMEFVKYFGSKDQSVAKDVCNHYVEMKVKGKVLSDSRTCELGKLLDTTYYGVVIAWHGEMKKLCDLHKVDFDEACTDFNKTYNDGYSKLNMSHVVRPVLYPPNGKIGGHCVVPNAKILSEDLESQMIKSIIELE